MPRVKYLRLVCLLCLVAFSYAAPSRVLAQTAKPAESAQADRDQTLRQLLTEVRELRLAVQRAMVSSTRFQMLIERVRVQQAHVDTLSRQLESVHSQAAEMKAAKPQMEQQIKDAEGMLERTSDPIAHAELESRIKVFKAESCGNLPRVVKQLHHARRAFERRTVNTAFDREANTPVKGLEGVHQILNATRFLQGAEAHVDFHFCLCRNHIAACSPTNHADIKARAASRIVQRM